MNQNQKDINKIRKDTSTVLYIVILILIIISVTLGVSYFKENKKTKNLNQTIDKLQEEKDDLVSKNKELKKEQKELETKIEELQKEDEEVGYDVSKFESINSNDFINMFNQKNKTYFIYTGRNNCKFCLQFIPVLNKSIKEYDYNVYYLDVNTISNSDYENIINLDAKLEENFGYTPMVFVINNGQVIDVNVGYTEYSEYKIFLEENKVHLK